MDQWCRSESTRHSSASYELPPIAVREWSLRAPRAARLLLTGVCAPSAPRPSRAPSSPTLARVLLIAIALGGIGRPSSAQEVVVAVAPISISASTGDKPQSKVWQHAGTWWAVLPSVAFSNSADAGTWLWRLEGDDSWTSILRLSSSTVTKADALALGDVTHVLLYQGTSTDLVSIGYDAPADTYKLWAQRPTRTRISLANSEIATIDVDSTERMWLATENGSNIVVHYSDPPYATFAGPVVLESGIDSDDIGVVTALPNGTVGVLWSNQNDKQFGFRIHVDGTTPTAWLADEIPAAGGISGGVADDHLNVATASDGTLFAAVKTSFNTAGHAEIALLVRRPDGSGPGGIWENQFEPEEVYALDDQGTRGIVLVNEDTATVRVMYTSKTGGGDIVCRESKTNPIDFGVRRTLLGGSLNDVTSTKSSWTDGVVVLTSGGGSAKGVRIARNTGAATSTTTTTTLPPTTTTTTLPPTTTTTTLLPTTTTTTLPPTTTTTTLLPTTTTTTLPPTTTTTLPPTTTTTLPPTTTTTLPPTTTTTTLPSSIARLAVRVAAHADDAEERASDGRMALGSSDLELIREASDQLVGVRFTGVTIPRKATVRTAYLQFQVDEATTEATELTIRGENADQALAFTTVARNISTRPTTTESVVWPVLGWNVVSAQGSAQRSPDIAAIVQRIVNRDGWVNGNALAFIVTGSGKRVAEAHEGSPTGAPLLYVEYAPPVGP
jgi:hypothetical protein